MADIDIFGTLNNATPDGVLARADQIKDETQNKKQSEINAEVKEQIEQLSQGGSGGGIEDAPSDGKTYGRKDGAWAEPDNIFQQYKFVEFDVNSKEVNIQVEGIKELKAGLRFIAKTTKGVSNLYDEPTLNINSLGAKPLYYNYAPATQNNAWTQRIMWVIFDGDVFQCGHIFGVGTPYQGKGEVFNDNTNKASGTHAHAEGVTTRADGLASHAEGKDTEAKSNYSHTQNYRTIAENFAQTSIGTGNTRDNSPSSDSYNAEKRAFVIGNGKWDTFAYEPYGDAFRVFFNGKVESDMNYSTPAADYAEMFEWKDGNISNEDRVGLFVTLDGENISLANAESKYILGVVSAVPAVLGDSPIQWHGKYLNDEWGRPIYEDVEYTEVKDVIKEDGSIEKVKEKKTAHVRKINPDYDGDMEYKPRAERQEWDAIGMLGKLMVKHDGTLVKGGFCKPSAGGIATKSESGYYVMKVINDYQALILFR